MNQPPAHLIFDLVHADEVSLAHEIETTEFLADEAATLEQFKMRQEVAPSLFLGAFLPPSSPDTKRTIIGYVCATRSELPTLTEESMKQHDPEGTSVCIHAVVVASQYQRRGIALALLNEFVSRLKGDGLTKRVLLICHEDMRPLYERAGFIYIGHSPVVHGALPWHEMRIVIDNTANSEDQQNLGITTGSPSSADAPATASESLPPGLLDALQQSSSSRIRPSPRLLSSFPGALNDVSVDSDETKLNKYDILCPRPACGSIILKAKIGSLVEKELPELEPVDKAPAALLTPLPPARSDVICWLVQPSPMAFENIGFSRAVDRASSSQGVRPRLKLLSCADCDLGPLGWCLEGGREFWLVCARVGYRI